MKNWWDEEDHKKRQKQKEIIAQLQKQRKPTSAAAIESALSEQERSANHAQLQHMVSSATRIGADSKIADDTFAPLTLTNNWFQNVNFRFIPTGWGWEDTPKKETLTEETIVAAVPAHRMWRAPLMGQRLRSSFRSGTLWPIRKRLEAVCVRQECDGAYCDCGIYAWKSADYLTEYQRFEVGSDVLKTIWGEVWLWGRIVECSRGYRAQYAYPKSFKNTGLLAQQYAEIYGVPCV